VPRLAENLGKLTSNRGWNFFGKPNKISVARLAKVVKCDDKFE
jgi:hypothetical protein